MIRASFGKTAKGRLLLGAGALALLMPAIAGCEAGNNAPTLEYHPAAAGAHAAVNGITITNVFVLGGPSGATVAAGKSASLFMSLFNTGNGGDKLVSVSAPGTASTVLVAGGTVALPANTAVNLTGPQPSVVLKNLSKPLTSGGYVSVTLDFQKAGTVSLRVPVEPQSFFWATYSPPPADASPSAIPASHIPAPTPVDTTPVPKANGHTPAPTASASASASS